uniref:Uncharacterized protein n=1 Tax=Anguilla anguilla TaxID=7936 RepID=A0A0E9SGY0_ANGAN
MAISQRAKESVMALIMTTGNRMVFHSIHALNWTKT